jgi:large subunit ribosomal protein L15
VSQRNDFEVILSADTGRRAHKRVGRGIGSGLGKTAGRGFKGEGSRSGGRNKGPLFEGGQFPLWQRVPKRGFTNFLHKTVYQPVRLSRVLERVKGDVIDAETLAQAGLAAVGERIKLVGGVEVKRKLTVRIHAVTVSVRQAIEAAGGSVDVING